LLGEELTSHNCSCIEIQQPPGENNRSDYLAQIGSEFSQVPIAICPLERRNQTLLTSQISGETTSELALITRLSIRPRTAKAKKIK
jgi:hypothetical protein